MPPTRLPAPVARRRFCELGPLLDGRWLRLLAFFHLPPTLPVLLLLAFIPILLRQVVFYYNAWYSAVVSGRIGLRMRVQTLDATLSADPEFFARHAVGDLVGIVINQTTAAGQAVLAVIKQLSIALLDRGVRGDPLRDLGAR